MSAEQEWSVRCPDGEVWDERMRDADVATRYAVEADEVGTRCACETSPHVAVIRVLPEWVPA